MFALKMHIQFRFDQLSEDTDVPPNIVLVEGDGVHDAGGIDNKIEPSESAGDELKQLRDFYSGKQESLDDMMHLDTEDRTDQELQDLAAYWSSVDSE